MSGPTVDDLGQIFGFHAADVAANRDGRVTMRQRVRLITREGPMTVGLTVGGLVAAPLFGWLATISWQHPRFWDDPFWTLVGLSLAGVLCFVGGLSLGFNLVRDTLTAKVAARYGRMRVTPGVVRVVCDSSGDGTFDLSLSDRRNARLRERAPDPFECIVYRTERGDRLLSIDPVG